MRYYRILFDVSKNDNISLFHNYYLSFYHNLLYHYLLFRFCLLQFIYHIGAALGFAQELARYVVGRASEVAEAK